MEIYVTWLSKLSCINYDSAELPPADLAELAKFFASGVYRCKFVSRLLVRRILSQKLQIEPQNIRFRKNNYGKPYVENNPLYFNVTHSNDMIAVAVDTNEMGLDTEYMKMRAFNSLAASFFDEAAVAKIAKIQNKEDKREAFYKEWTRHEALVKLKGHSVFDTPDAMSAYTMSCRLGDYMLTVASFTAFDMVVHNV